MKSSRHSYAIRCLLVSCILAPLVGYVFIAPTQKTVARKQDVVRCCSSQKQMFYAPLVGVHESIKGELVLSNRGVKNNDVNLTFYSTEGEAINDQVITLAPHEVQRVNLRRLTPLHLRGQHKLGGIILSYEGPFMEIAAQLALFDREKASSADVVFSSDKEYKSTIQEAVWWMPGNATAAIALGNSSDSAISATLAYTTGESQNVQLNPHATEVIYYHSRKRGHGAAHSVRVDVNGPVSSLRAAGYVLTDTNQIISGIRFYDPASVDQPNLFATNVRLKNVTPHLTLKNTSDGPITANPIFMPLSGDSSGTIELPPVSLAPYQATEVDLTPLRDYLEAGSDIEAVSLRIDNTGGPGSLVGAFNSIDQTTHLSRDIPLRDSGTPNKSVGNYPWRIDGDYNSVASVTNVSKLSAQFMAVIYHKNGKYVINPRRLAPGETAIFDFREIRDQQVPDAHGNILPSSVSKGQFYWGLWGEESRASLIGRSEIFSKLDLTSNSFSCGDCCPPSFWRAELRIDNNILEVDNATHLSAVEVDVDCHGEATDVIITFPDDHIWNESVPGTCRVDYDPGVFRNRLIGMSPGNTNISTGWNALLWSGNGGEGNECHPFEINATTGPWPVQVFDFTISFNRNDLYPTGTGAPNVSTTATVTVQTNPVIANRTVNLFIGEIVSSGGHINHSGTRPLGNLAANQGVTGPNGAFSTMYTSSIFGGEVAVNASVSNINRTKGEIMRVGVPGLSLLGAGTNYTIRQNDPYHPEYHYGNQTMLNSLPQIADEYATEYYGVGNIPNADKLVYNDMSIIKGGKFEAFLNNNTPAAWGPGVAHNEHRLGTNCDVPVGNLPPARRTRFMEICFIYGVSDVHDEIASGNHYHLRY